MENQETTDIFWMKKALSLAKKAGLRGEVPVGALVVGPEGLIAKASNQRESTSSPLGHAELIALHRASQKRSSWRLSDCTLYVTLEPCVMCAGAISQSRIQRVVYATKDEKSGAVDSHFQILSSSLLNHQCEVTSGVLKDSATELIQDFFKAKRTQHKQKKQEQKQQQIYRERASVVVIHEGKILGFAALDPVSDKSYFFIPGGSIEVGETAIETAQRETLEETGYEVEIDSQSEFIREYPFFWAGQEYYCKTYFYLATLKNPKNSPQVVSDASYHKGVRWESIQKASELFAYSSDIVWAVQKLLKKSKRNSVLP